MRWLIVNTDYPEFTEWLYVQHPGLAREPYATQWQARADSLFGLADFYSTNLAGWGHEAWDVIANNETLQRQWAREHAVKLDGDAEWVVRLRRGCVPQLRRRRSGSWLPQILEAQLKAYRPDVFYCMALETLGSDFVRRTKRYCRLAIGQHASMIPPVDVRAYDLVLSSLPNLVDHFRAHGMRSEYFRLAFEPRVLAHLNGMTRVRDLVFVGGLSGVQHDAGARLLEQLGQRFDVRIYGYGTERLPANSPLRGRCAGPLWGRAMYQVFRTAKIVLNRHGPIALRYANNMRLFEAAGVGTLLLTERKDNLAELFEPGREVVTYDGVEECSERAAHYLAHDDEREAIAAAGQARTLREHTWAQRMQELVEIVRRYL